MPNTPWNSGEVQSRTRNQSRQAGDEVEWVEDDVGGAVAKRLLEPIDDLSPSVGREPLVGDGGSCDVAPRCRDSLGACRAEAGSSTPFRISGALSPKRSPNCLTNGMLPPTPMRAGAGPRLLRKRGRPLRTPGSPEHRTARPRRRCRHSCCTRGSRGCGRLRIWMVNGTSAKPIWPRRLDSGNQR